MKIISIHSHKGGAGKTTIALFLAKAFAMEGQKVCAVDIDFVGSGYEDILKIKKAKKTLNDYVLALPGEKVPIQDIISTYYDSDLKNREIHLILNTGHSDKEDEQIKSEERRDLKSEMLWYIGREKNMRKVGYGVLQLLKELSAEGYEWCFLDCHPGIYELSISLLNLFQIEKDFRTSLALFVATTNRAHLLGLLRELNWWGTMRENKKRIIILESSLLVVNRIVDKDSSWEEIKVDIQNAPFMDIEGTTLIRTLEKTGFFKNRQIIRESPQMLKYAEITSDGLLPVVESKSDIGRLCKKIETILLK